MIENTEKKLPEKEEETSVFGWLFGGILLIALALLGVSLIASRPEITNPVVSANSAFYGQKVNVTGQVSDVYGIQAISLADSGLADQQVLVVSRVPLVAMGGGADDVLYEDGDRVTVEGVVRPFRISEVEQELGVDLVDSMFTVWEGKPVVIANVIEQTP